MSKRNKKKNIGKNEKKTIWDKCRENKRVMEIAGVALVAVVAVLLVIVAVNSNPIYGTYRVGNLLYLNSLCNIPESGYEEDYVGVSISNGKFVITYEEKEEVIKRPKYKIEEATDELLLSWQEAMSEKTDAEYLQGVTKVHFVYDAENKRTDYAILEKEDGMLFVQYYIIRDIVDIWHVFELK